MRPSFGGNCSLLAAHLHGDPPSLTTGVSGVRDDVLGLPQLSWYATAREAAVDPSRSQKAVSLLMASLHGSSASLFLLLSRNLYLVSDFVQQHKKGREFPHAWD